MSLDKQGENTILNESSNGTIQYSGYNLTPVGVAIVTVADSSSALERV